MMNKNELLMNHKQIYNAEDEDNYKNIDQLSQQTDCKFNENSDSEKSNYIVNNSNTPNIFG